jgi:hypothetical protein
LLIKGAIPQNTDLHDRGIALSHQSFSCFGAIACNWDYSIFDKYFTAITPVPEPDSESSPLAKRLFYEGEGKTLRERALEIAAGITRHLRASA